MTAIVARFRARDHFRNIVPVGRIAGMVSGVLGAGFVALGTATAQSVELPAGPNREIVSHECAACHDLDMVVAAAGASRQAWSDTIDEMIRYGARIDPEDRSKILDYLASSLGSAARMPAAR
jgi:hypothetical protein